MRLLNTTTLNLTEFFGECIPDYAILSHTWDKEEITMPMLEARSNPSFAGWEKVKKCCERALKDGWEYVWIDTCCIDKTSSVELSEAINSMFKWYEDSGICYVYLSDVDTALRRSKIEKRFKSSRWFKRGFTLQELLAPMFHLFLDRNWKEIGYDDDLKELVALSADIELAKLKDFKSCCVAEKFRWASRRSTTRLEDEAYCLLGLFDINMPLLYGEGPKAMDRLQVELIARYNDESIFAWTANYRKACLLATSCQDFERTTRVVTDSTEGRRRTFSITNQGLNIVAPLYTLKDRTEEDGSPYLLKINCLTRIDGLTKYFHLFLRKHGASSNVFTVTDCRPLSEDKINRRYSVDAQPTSIVIENVRGSDRELSPNHWILEPAFSPGWDLHSLKYRPLKKFDTDSSRSTARKIFQKNGKAKTPQGSFVMPRGGEVSAVITVPGTGDFPQHQYRVFFTALDPGSGPSVGLAQLTSNATSAWDNGTVALTPATDGKRHASITREGPGERQEIKVILRPTSSNQAIRQTYLHQAKGRAFAITAEIK